jgi:hypothetical protein
VLALYMRRHFVNYCNNWCQVSHFFCFKRNDKSK